MPKEKTEGNERCESKDQEPKHRSGDEEGPRAVVAPVREKIGEDRDNLRQRGEWFQRRTGSRS